LWAYVFCVSFSVITHPVLAPATAHNLECSLAGTVELGTAHGVFLGIGFLTGCLRLSLKLALSTEHMGPLILALFGSLLSVLMRTLVCLFCLLLGFSGKRAFGNHSIPTPSANCPSLDVAQLPYFLLTEGCLMMQRVAQKVGLLLGGPWKGCSR
jgi:hypothetical protein